MITQQLESLKGKEVIISQGGFLSAKQRLEEHHIPYTVTTQPLQCPTPQGFFFTNVGYCEKK
ncbi:hypothetical protein ACFDTO_23505 [Microbacteriaceae bacterium 4G12]